jgi:NitT/TauT family transport system permease protein
MEALTTERPRQSPTSELPRSPIRSRKLKVALLQVAVGVIALVLWEISIRMGMADPFVFGQPSKVFRYLVFEALPSRQLWTDAGYTMAGTGIAFAIGSFLGIACGLLFDEFGTVGDVARPYVTLLNSLPRVALAPLFIVWFGLGLTSKVALGISLVFFILLLNTIAGALAVDHDLVRLCRSLGATRWTIFRKITLPSALPSIFAGLKLGLVYALLGVVVGEMIGAIAGLGMRVVLYSNLFEMNKVFGLLLFLALTTTLLSQGMHRLEQFLLRWREDQEPR